MATSQASIRVGVVAGIAHWASEEAFKQATSTDALISQIRQQVAKLGTRPTSYELINTRH